MTKTLAGESFGGGAPMVLMLLTNAYDPDPRVRQEALALVAAGYRVRILAWDRDRARPAAESMEGVEIERVYLASRHGRGATQIFFYALLYLRMLRRALRTPFDAVHCHDLDTLPLGFVAGKLKRRPVIYDAHESFPDMLTGSVPAPIRSALTRLENFLIRRVDVLITVGEKLRRHFAERGARRSVVIGNWKRISEFSRTEEQNLETRRRLGIPAGALTVVCITQLLRDRKLPEVLEAVEKRSDVYLVVGGAGAMEGAVKAAAERCPRIRYAGFVSASGIAAYTCAADIVYYGFDPQNPNARFSAPNKLYEALTAGRPLITGDFGEIADVVRESGCGVVLKEYSPAEIAKALDILSDPGVRRDMARRAYDVGRDSMNWDRGEQVLCSEYRTLIPASARDAAAAGQARRGAARTQAN